MPKFPLRKEDDMRAEQQLTKAEIKGRGDSTVCSNHIPILKEGNKRHCPEALSTIKKNDERVLQISVSGTQGVQYIFSLFLIYCSFIYHYVTRRLEKGEKKYSAFCRGIENNFSDAIWLETKLQPRSNTIPSEKAW